MRRKIRIALLAALLVSSLFAPASLAAAPHVFTVTIEPGVIFAALPDIEKVRVYIGIYESPSEIDQWLVNFQSGVTLTPSEARTLIAALHDYQPSTTWQVRKWGEFNEIAFVGLPGLVDTMLVTNALELRLAVLDEANRKTVADQIAAALNEVVAQFLP